VARPIAEPATDTRRETSSRPLLSIVVPVYNGGPEIVENIGDIRRRAAGALPPEDVELVVVSDGSIDGTSERLLAARSDVDMRVIHYDRNFGKGYAVKLGALTASGEWIAVVDADLDLDPASIPAYLETARREGLDFAIGSKRHPGSVVDYPRSRRVASWCYQQLNRLLFRLDVRDTQVGLKVFRREIATRVVPLLLVKQFAFDLELLAVARALGFRRVRELPIRLDYRFTGSQVRSRAVLRALFDTAAVFYRLRILRTYQRKRRLLGSADLRPDEWPPVAVVGAVDAGGLDYPLLEHVDVPESASSEVLAVFAAGARPAGNFVTAAVPFLARDDVAVVVAPSVAPSTATTRERAAAAVLESRLGGGSRRSRFFPGNIRLTDDFAADGFVVRRDDFVAATRAGAAGELVGWLAERGRKTVYTPDTMVSAAPRPLFASHLSATFAHAAARGAAARRSRGASVSSATTLSLVPAAGALAGLLVVAFGPRPLRGPGAALVGAYGAAVVGSAGLAAARFRSVRVGALAVPGLLATQSVYVAGFVRGLAARR
jgi:glycosyltransferase involved in cell wall biosynthesis